MPAKSLMRLVLLSKGVEAEVQAQVEVQDEVRVQLSSGV